MATLFPNEESPLRLATALLMETVKFTRVVSYDYACLGPNDPCPGSRHGHGGIEGFVAARPETGVESPSCG